MTRLGACLATRDNNLNLLRALSAGAVIVSHASLVLTGDEMLEPLRESTGLSLGKFAVIVFFGISGLLIAQSFDRRRTILGFCLARIFRLWPALGASLLVSAFIIGPVATTFSAGGYFSMPGVWTFVPENLTLAIRQQGLPGVFSDNPLAGVVNGSLWSLFYEVSCYGLVLVIGVLGLLKRPRAFIALATVLLVGHVLTVTWAPQGGVAFRLQILGFFGFPFALGMAAYVWRDQLPLNLPLVMAAWLLPAAFWASAYLPSCLMVALVYTSFWLAFIPTGFVRQYNRVGDYSYGLYVYAFPVQQALVHWLPGLDLRAHLFLAFLIVTPLAVASWHLLEKPALMVGRKLG